MESVIKTKSESNRWQVWLIFFIPAAAMGAAWFIYFTGIGASGRTNQQRKADAATSTVFRAAVTGQLSTC